MLTNTHIAIVGAGPAGLLLARKLHLSSIPFTIFDRDESPSHRPQGGMLDLHPDTGQYALRSAGLMEEFKKVARYEDQGMRIVDKRGTLVFGDDGADSDRPEIDRGQLRDLLLRSIPDGSVRWGHALKEATKLDDGSIELHFANGVIERFDFVVGADGAWSKLRPLLSAIQPKHTGITMFELSIPDADKRYPDIAQFVGRGTLIAKGDRKTIFAQRNAKAHVRVYAALNREAVDLEQPVFEETKTSLIAEFQGWGDRLLQLIDSADEEIRPWPIYMLPVGHRWEHDERITLLGDAAHLMPPAGDGANLALRDAADLADALASDGDWKTAVRAHESVMFERAALSAADAQKMLIDGSAEDSLERMTRFMSEAI